MVMTNARQVRSSGLITSSVDLFHWNCMDQVNQRLHWIDRLKAIALLWIFTDHASERIFGEPYLANPDGNWPSAHQQIAQLAPLHGFGAMNVPANLFRYLGWVGDYGVGLFLLLSGFALVWACLNRGEKSVEPITFYGRRLNRIYPMWIAAHVCLLLPLAVLGLHVSLADPSLYWSMLGVRVTPDQFYFGWSAWWFIGLILQLYLLFPFLYSLLQRCGPVMFMVITVSIALAIRGAGLFYFVGYLDCWNRGAIFITRLPEFAVGMGLAVWVHRGVGARLASLPAMMLGLLAIAAGFAGSFTLIGMSFAPFLASTGTFLILFGLFNRLERVKRSLGLLPLLDWLGFHSLSLYLVHQPFVRALTHLATSPSMLVKDLVGCVVALALAAIAAVVLETGTAIAMTLFNRWRQSTRRSAIGIGVAALVALIWGVLIAAELHVRHTDAQEAGDLGWGERPSLRPDPVFAWNLIPDQKTRLRWETYDYVVTANNLGFPGPEYPEKKPDGVYRVLVTGDAFTSAEGVDTEKAWPRLLEAQLADQMHRPVQVMNFAITGYGPNQYAAVVNTFAAKFKPDLILIGLFINDYGDVLTTDDAFRTSIGFGKVDPDGIMAIATFRQLASLVRTKIIHEVDHLRHHPDAEGYFLGHFHFLERDCDDETGEGRTLMQQRLADIKKVADQIGAKVAIAMIPSSPQVCPPNMLAYWPEGIDLTDKEKFDPDLPQRTTRAIAATLSIPCYDLRPPLKASLSEGNPYQSHNMHWTPLGHRVAADYLAKVLATP
jgi:peptidoglycan/LPS O-acetylase OafA/YrhL